MKTPLSLVATCSAAVLFTSCATKHSTDSNAPTGPVSATVRLSESQAAYWASAKGGKGTITYMGQTHEFSIVGLGAGGTGLQRIDATGDVYNLNNLSDFAGTYTGLRTGITLIKGKTTAKLKNEHDVILYLTGKTFGLASSSGIDKFIIKLKDPVPGMITAPEPPVMTGAPEQPEMEATRPLPY